MIESTNTLEYSRKLFFSLQTRSLGSIERPPKYAENASFDKNFPGMFVERPFYKNCKFVGSTFERPACESSQLISCVLYDCKINNADFRYCNFEHTVFESKDDLCYITNSNLSFGTLIDTKFIGIKIEGTPFKEMVIDNCIFDNCNFDSFGFERSTIKNCSFFDTDMSKIVFRFCDFENIKFRNVIIHILDLAKNYGLINELKKNGENIKIFYGQNNYVSLDEAIKLLPNLLMHYYDAKEYYYVINILMLENRYDELWSVLQEAFKYEIACNDYAVLQDLCTLTVKLNVFDNYKLKQLYEIITTRSSPNDLSRHQLKSYTSYMNNIKSILLENPNEFPTARIIISTNVMPGNIEKIAPLLNTIESNISNNFPTLNSKIQISHHSPYDIEIIISAVLPELLTVCQLFYYGFGGIKSLKDIISSRHEKYNKGKTKQLDDNKPSKKRTNKTGSKKISLKLGSFEFKYEKTCEEMVNSVEYIIT